MSTLVSLVMSTSLHERGSRSVPPPAPPEHSGFPRGPASLESEGLGSAAGGGGSGNFDGTSIWRVALELPRAAHAAPFSERSSEGLSLPAVLSGCAL